MKLGNREVDRSADDCARPGQCQLRRMSNRILRATFLFSLCLTIAPLAQAAPAKRAITEKDLFAFVWIGDPQVSPDGSHVVYVRVTVNEKKDGYDTSIWMAPTTGEEAPRQLTSGPHDSAPRWSPDGKWIVFSRALEKEGKKQPPQLCLLPMAGGDAFVFTDLPKGASDPKWSPDGKSILFTQHLEPGRPRETGAEEKAGRSVEAGATRGGFALAFRKEQPQERRRSGRGRA